MSRTRSPSRGSSKTPGVERVSYPALPGSPYHALAQKYLPRGAGAIFSFDLRRARGRPALHRGAATLEPSGQRRRRQEPGHPSRQHDPPPVERRGTGRRRHHARHHSPLGRPRDPRRPDLGSRARPARRRASRRAGRPRVARRRLQVGRLQVRSAQSTSVQFAFH